MKPVFLLVDILPVHVPLREPRRASSVFMYQSKNTVNLLFVCSENQLRSPTAEAVFSRYLGISAIGAGTNSDSETPVSGDLVEWADVVLVMEKSHRNKISKKYKKLLKGKRLICLDIPDHYEYMQPELVKLFKTRVPRFVRLEQAAHNAPVEPARFR